MPSRPNNYTVKGLKKKIKAEPEEYSGPQSGHTDKQFLRDYYNKTYAGRGISAAMKVAKGQTFNEYTQSFRRRGR